MKYSIVKLSELDKIVFRLDAEFYHPEYLLLQDKLLQFNSATLKQLGAYLDCSAFYPSIVPYYNFEKVGIPFLRVNEIQNGMLNISSDTAFLPSEIIQENSTTIACCHPGDLIIAKGGNSLGKVALVTSQYLEYSVCRDVLILKTQNLSNVNYYYLWIFLYSEVGKKTLLRTASQTGQPHLTLEAINQLEVPIFIDKFQQYFEILYNKSHHLKITSDEVYNQAQNFLLSELGLNNWQSQNQLTFVKNYSDTQKANRFDAEYYQPKYEEIVNSIKNYAGGWDTLENLVTLKDTNFTPQDDVTYKYIELSNITENGEITDYMIENGQELPTRARRTVITNDVIVSSIEGSLSSIALIEQDYDQSLCSTGFYVINSNYFSSQVLLVLLKSIIGQLQLKKGCSGTILTAINKDEFCRIVLPKINPNIQNQIKLQITESFDLRKQSKHLLECAKKAVEIAIEQDEQTAINWLDENTGE